MKEATGEVSMTMVTIVAIAVIGGILAFMWPTLSNWIANSFGGNQKCPEGYHYDGNSHCVRDAH